MFRLYLSHRQAFKIQIHTVNEQCIVGSPTLTIHRVNNNENMYVAVLMVYNNGLNKQNVYTGVKAYRYILICVYLVYY
jgi:hypothetical protein